MKNGTDSVRISRATLAIILALSAPIAQGAVAYYRIIRVEREEEKQAATIDKFSTIITQLSTISATNAAVVSSHEDKLDSIEKQLAAVIAKQEARGW